MNTVPKSLNSAALDILQAHDWPGNVRQLVNATRRLTVTAPGGVITAVDINADLGQQSSTNAPGDDWTQSLQQWAEQKLADDSGVALLDLATPQLEKTLIRIALKKACGHRQEAARILGWGRNTLSRKIRALGIE